MINLKKDSIIYVLCPGNCISGGPEAMHQLRYYLEKCGLNAYLVYYYEYNTHPRFQCYNPKVLSLEEIKDEKNNVIIVSENSTKLLKNYHHATKCIWWLSLVFHDGENAISTTFSQKTVKFIKEIIPFSLYKSLKNNYLKRKNRELPYWIGANDVNLTASKFAYNYVNNKYKNVKMFVEPISMDFLINTNPNLTTEERCDIIPYNPSKPSEIMTKLLKRDDLKFVPIQNMIPSEIIDLLRKSKLYIDFGFFGGPERIPKEAVHNGTLLLVGKRNAAENDFDVAIPNEFKIKDYNNEEFVVRKIKYMLANYDKLIPQFEPFRKKILALEENFISSIKETFVIED